MNSFIVWLARMEEVLVDQHRVANAQRAQTVRLAGRLQVNLQDCRIDEVSAQGLHASLTHHLARVGELVQEERSRFFGWRLESESSSRLGVVEFDVASAQ